jgi:hypothetical protein
MITQTRKTVALNPREIAVLIAALDTLETRLARKLGVVDIEDASDAQLNVFNQIQDIEELTDKLTE